MPVIVSPQESLFVAVNPGRREALNLPDDAYGELLDLQDQLIMFASLGSRCR